MSKVNDGGSAFPYETWSRNSGMSLRDWFAGMAMQGHMASWGQHDVTDYSEIAVGAYRLADAMIAEKEKA